MPRVVSWGPQCTREVSTHIVGPCTDDHDTSRDRPRILSLLLGIPRKWRQDQLAHLPAMLCMLFSVQTPSVYRLVDPVLHRIVDALSNFPISS